jgi:uncharacterized protein (DUF305 family)
LQTGTRSSAVVVLLLAGLATLATLWIAGVPGPFERAGERGQRGPMGPMGGMGAGMEMVDSEFGYLAHMIPHHEEAIASAGVLLEGSDREEMRTFAESIIETQSAEVTRMRGWLTAWYPDRDAAVDYEPMMRDLDGLTGNDLDRAFLEDMIGHHMEAVMMSQQLLARDLAEHDDVIPFARQIRDSQRAEILQMRTWLQDWFGVSPMGPMGAGH